MEDIKDMLGTFFSALMGDMFAMLIYLAADTDGGASWMKTMALLVFILSNAITYATELEKDIDWDDDMWGDDD